MEPSRGSLIILVRHGETEANRRRCFAESDEIPLTDIGRRQAHQIAARLAREFQPAALFSSAFTRATQTGEIIGQLLGLQNEVIAGVHERDFGRLRGLPYEHLGAMPVGDETRFWKPEGGESLEEVRSRAVPAIEALRLRYPGQQVVVVCHGAVIRAICAHITGEWDETWVIANCEIALLEYKDAGWKRPVVCGDIVKM